MEYINSQSPIRQESEIQLAKEIAELVTAVVTLIVGGWLILTLLHTFWGITGKLLNKGGNIYGRCIRRRASGWCRSLF